MSEYKLTPYERETVITFNEDEKDARIYTCSNKVIAQIEKIMSKSIGVISILKSDEYSKTYSIPKSYIRFRTQIKRELSEEERRKIGERLRKSRNLNTGDSNDCN